MDEITWLFVVSAVLAAFWSTLIGLLHVRGWLPAAYTRRLSDIQRSAAAQIGIEVENALNRVAEAQRASYEAEAKKLETSAAMSMVRSVGVDKQMQATVSRALSEAILGPALPILRQFAPGLADTLEENPQLVDVIIQNPLFKKYIEPRLAAFLGSKSEPSSENPFLKGLNP